MDRTTVVLLYALMLLLPLSALIARRPPLRRTLLFAAIWAGVFGLGLLAVTYLS